MCEAFARRENRKLSPADIASAIQRYEGGATLAEIAPEYGISVAGLAGLFKRRGVKMRPAHTPSFVTRPDCFADPACSEEAAYMVGFLMADGNVCDRPGRTPAVRLAVQIRDREIVDRLNVMLGGGYAISVIEKPGPNDQPQATISFAHPRVVADLIQHGVTPRKTWTASFPDYLADSRHAMRGLVDGDGSLCWHTIGGRLYPMVRLVGSAAVCRQFTEFVRRASPGFEGQSRVGRFGVSKIDIVGRHAAAAARVLYEGCTIALSRKAAVAAELMRWVPKHPRKTKPPREAGAVCES